MHQKAHHIDDNENDADNDGDGYDEDDNDGSIENTAPENKPPGELLARSRIGSPIHELTPLHISQQYIMLSGVHSLISIWANVHEALHHFPKLDQRDTN